MTKMNLQNMQKKNNINQANVLDFFWDKFTWMFLEHRITSVDDCGVVNVSRGHCGRCGMLNPKFRLFLKYWGYVSDRQEGSGELWFRNSWGN